MKVFVTGHRPAKLGGYDPLSEKNQQIRLCFERILKQAKEAQPDIRVNTGMALGFDQIVAAACIATNTPFHAHIPFVGQEHRWPKGSQDYYNALLEKAEEVVVCSEPPSNKGEAVKAMMIRNSSMAEDNDVVACISCWDGSNSGTADAVRKALKRGMWICNIDPNNLSEFKIEWRQGK